MILVRLFRQHKRRLQTGCLSTGIGRDKYIAPLSHIPAVCELSVNEIIRPPAHAGNVPPLCVRYHDQIIMTGVVWPLARNLSLDRDHWL